MSNSIWKMPEKNPDGERLYVKEDNDGVFVCLTNKVSEDAIIWAYIDDLIAQADKAERLQKAVEKALHYLDAEYHAYIMVHQKEPELIAKVLEEIKQVIKGE